MRSKDWMPEPEASKYLHAILSMTTDTLMGRGVVTKEMFIANLRTYADLLGKLKEEK